MTFAIKATKLDEFWEKFQTAFEPSSSFLENYIAFFSENVQKALYNGPKSAI